ncbi:MAG: hypothetical protein A4E57_02344 [Syntrophorhabdaceae bacterium PtaU1.Bin034]|jgi:AmmeMemoRadiSam system protein B|nr:MAG: hypothetical protein A4E57_02344 [Syntrophorhabdaceae bacterium PtaU1.Bin034]
MDNGENAKVRWVDIVPVNHEGRQVFVIRDPEGITDKSLVVTREVLFLLSLMDGARSVRDIQEEYLRASGKLMYTEQITSVIETMDKHFLLLNDRYESEVQRLRKEFDAMPCRTAFLSGRSYPDNAEELGLLLDGFLMQGRGDGGSKNVKAMIAPHIDYERGMGVYGPTYRHLPEEEGTLFVIFGTCHKFAPRTWNISLKDLVTPLGTIKAAEEVGRLIREDPYLKEYIDEWPHRNEHSIELQLPIIQYFLKKKDFEVLSILTGSLHEYMEDGARPEQGEAAELVKALKGVLKAYDGPVVFLAAADLAHIGAQFGDPGPLDRLTLQDSEQRDGELLHMIRNVDAAGFFETVRREGDRRRICGLSPIYFVLSMLDSCRGEVIGYQQWTDGASSVSFVGAVFY